MGLLGQSLCWNERGAERLFFKIPDVCSIALLIKNAIRPSQHLSFFSPCALIHRPNKSMPPAATASMRA
jgi:hypothetical protein